MPESQTTSGACRKPWTVVEFGWYRRRMSAAGSGGGASPDGTSSKRALPRQRITVNQLIGFNIAWFRKAGGLTQEQLGARLGGWSAASVSAAERSWDGKRIRKFDADEIVSIASALGIPAIGLFLPPPGDGEHVHYFLRELGGGGGSMAYLLVMVMPYDLVDEQNPAMAAYLERLAQANGRYFEMEAVDFEREQKMLEQRVLDLRVFEQEYRRRLRAYLKGQLEALGTEEDE
jgi:transcriptional regulator with XRE-family HTH domain